MIFVLAGAHFSLCIHCGEHADVRFFSFIFQLPEEIKLPVSQCKISNRYFTLPLNMETYPASSNRNEIKWVLLAVPSSPKQPSPRWVFLRAYNHIPCSKEMFHSIYYENLNVFLARTFCCVVWLCVLTMNISLVRKC